MHTSCKYCSKNDQPVELTQNNWVSMTLLHLQHWEHWMHLPTTYSQEDAREHGARDKARWTTHTDGGRLLEFQSWSRRQRGGCWGNNGRGHLSCVAALPFAYNRLGDQSVVAFFSLPSFPGTLLSLTMGLLSPPSFCQRLTLRVCSFFFLLFLTPQENKT